MNIKRSLQMVLFIPLSSIALMAGDGTDAVNSLREASLDKLLQEALEHNPELKAAESEWKAAGHRSAIDKSLPNPMFTFGGMDKTGSGNFPNTSEKRYEVSQGLPWYGKRDDRGLIARKEADIARSELDSVRLDLILAVKETYYELFSVRQTLDILRAEETLLNRLVDNVTTRYSAGKSEQQDVIKAGVELTMLKQRILDLSAKESSFQARFNILLNRKKESPVLTLEAPVVDNDIEPDANGDDARPDVAAARARLAKSEIEYSLMKKEAFPDIILGLEYRTYSDNIDADLMFKIGLDIPLWRSRVNAGKNEAANMVEAGKSRLESIRNKSYFEVKDALFKVQAAKQSSELYRKTIIPQAELGYKASESSYQAGKGDFLDLLDSERLLLDARIMGVMTDAGYWTEVARFERSAGIGLEAHVKK